MARPVGDFDIKKEKFFGFLRFLIKTGSGVTNATNEYLARHSQVRRSSKQVSRYLIALKKEGKINWKTSEAKIGTQKRYGPKIGFYRERKIILCQVQKAINSLKQIVPQLAEISIQKQPYDFLKDFSFNQEFHYEEPVRMTIDLDQQKKNEQEMEDYGKEMRRKMLLEELPDSPPVIVHPDHKEFEAQHEAEMEAVIAANGGSMWGTIDIEIKGPERYYSSSDEEFMAKTDEELLEIAKELRKRTQGD